MSPRCSLCNDEMTAAAALATANIITVPATGPSADTPNDTTIQSTSTSHELALCPVTEKNVPIVVVAPPSTTSPKLALCTVSEKVPERGNQWKYGLFDCFSGEDGRVCPCACFCPCVLYSRIKERYTNPALTGYSYCNVDALIYCVGSGVSSFVPRILVMKERKKYRDFYNIEGSGCTDCLTVFFCNHCALIQHEKQLQSRGHAEKQAGGYLASPLMTISRTF